MKPYPVLAFALISITTSATLSAATFEGTVRMKMSQPRGDALEMTYRVKEGFVRTEIQTEKSTIATIVDLTKQEMLILMPEQKMYMTQSFAAAAEAAQSGKHAEVSFEKTSETEKILGYDCVKYVSKSKDQISDVWVTEELGRFVGLGQGGNAGGRRAQKPASWESALMNKDIFPLRVVSRNPKGVEQFRMEAVAVEKQAQPATLFAPPAGYQKFDMGSMMRGLIPGAKR
jgi:hypothetical protein